HICRTTKFCIIYAFVFILFLSPPLARFLGSTLGHQFFSSHCALKASYGLLEGIEITKWRKHRLRPRKLQAKFLSFFLIINHISKAKLVGLWFGYYHYALRILNCVNPLKWFLRA